MKSYETWLNESTSPGVLKEGGFTPKTPEQKRVFKKVDLIVLPKDIQGTNCFNCRYIGDKENEMGFCSHHEVRQYVTKKNCCGLWDHENVKREF
jgi:hypothetical protein